MDWYVIIFTAALLVDSSGSSVINTIYIGPFPMANCQNVATNLVSGGVHATCERMITSSPREDK
jgi:hypothetical protein